VTMGIVLYEKGDTMYYPDPFTKSNKPMKVIDRRIYIYPKGKFYVRYLYDNLLDRLIEEIHENVKEDLDNIIGIDGAEGVGKSSIAYWIAKKYNPDFDMKASYAVSFDELLDKIHEYNGKDDGAVFWLDEATKIGNKREWASKDNVAFMKLLQMFRSRHWLLLLCIPSVGDLDIYLREQRIRYEVHCLWLDWEGRPGNNRGYFQLERVDIKQKLKPRKSVGYGKYDPIPKDVILDYQTLKRDTQDDAFEELYDSRNKKSKREQQGQLNRKLILRMREEGHSVEEISEFTGLSEQTVMNYCTKARKERGDSEDD